MLLQVLSRHNGKLSPVKATLPCDTNGRRTGGRPHITHKLRNTLVKILQKLHFPPNQASHANIAAMMWKNENISPKRRLTSTSVTCQTRVSTDSIAVSFCTAAPIRAAVASTGTKPETSTRRLPLGSRAE
uniref:(northern house mosquito) hypothetical protein n=1 Tax=Culex pipiens TaxID=7175 RepID=A0A8D8FUB9_CULPI